MSRSCSVPITGTRYYLGQVGSATLQIRYATDCEIHKPLIVVEGFDSGLAGRENQFGESSFRTFNRESLDDTGTLGASLDTYDIIYVNWNNGKDYLQRNAYVLEDVIKYVNTRKASAGSTTPNVIIGQSMGGVIARYALRDMENLYASTGLATWQHKTNIYVSHDAPQQGANIPLGILYFARHLSKQFISTPLGGININPSSSGGSVTIADLESLIDAPGTQQLLKYSIGSNYAVTNSLSSLWQTELQNMGYPQQTRNIAISNGNHCANPQVFQPGAKLFSLTGNAKTSFLTDFLSILLSNISGASYGTAAILLNEPGLLLGVLPGRSKFNLDFQVNALPNAGTTAQIYKGKISFTKTLLWIAPITINLTNKSFSSPAGSLPLDYYPGGMYSLDFDFPNTSASSAFGSFGISSFLEPSFGFIPEPSALDIGRGNISLDNSDYLKKYSASTPLVAPKDSPFANYTTSFSPNSDLNEEHISFNKRSGDWLASELNTINNGGTPQVFDCTYVCSSSQITGSENVCTTANYTAPAGGVSYNWTITQGANLVNLTGNGTPYATLTALPDVSGQVTLSLIMGGSCGNIALTKTIWVGIPNTVFSNANGSQTGSTFNYGYNGFGNFGSFTDEINLNNSIGVNNGVLGAEYEVLDPISNTYVPRGNGSTVVVTSADAYQIEDMVYINVRGRVLSDCGWSEWGDLTLTSYAEYFNRYTVYPNPSNDIINIEIANKESQLNKEKKQQSTIASTITGELFDLMGKSMRKVEIKSDIASISVAGLPKGIYVLKIYIDGKTESHQIGVK